MSGLDSNEWVRVECGCQFGRIDDVFVLEPCGNPDCPILAYAIDEANRQGKPVIPVSVEHVDVGLN